MMRLQTNKWRRATLTLHAANRKKNAMVAFMAVAFLLMICLNACTSISNFFAVRHAGYTVATVTNDIASRASSKMWTRKYEYVVNGKKYSYDGPDWESLAKGDKFRIQYDSLNPSYVNILSEEPVFLSHEKTIKVPGTIINFFNTECEFSYALIDETYITYKKVQMYYKGTLEKYPAIKLGARFEVEYDYYNPKRAIIYFDRPVTE